VLLTFVSYLTHYQDIMGFQLVLGSTGQEYGEKTTTGLKQDLLQ